MRLKREFRDHLAWVAREIDTILYRDELNQAEFVGSLYPALIQLMTYIWRFTSKDSLLKK